MAAPEQTLSRLVDALEDLAAQESVALCAEDFATIAELQTRIEPVVSRIADLSSVADADVRRRIKDVFLRRQANYDNLHLCMARVQDELAEMDLSRRRVAQIAPVYGYGSSGASNARQLNLAG